MLIIIIIFPTLLSIRSHLTRKAKTSARFHVRIFFACTCQLHVINSTKIITLNSCACFNHSEEARDREWEGNREKNIYCVSANESANFVMPYLAWKEYAIHTHTLKCRRRRKKYYCPKLWNSYVRRSTHNIYVIRYHNTRGLHAFHSISLLCVFAHTNSIPAWNVSTKPNTYTIHEHRSILSLASENWNSIASSKLNSVLNHAPVGSFEKLSN